MDPLVSVIVPVYNSSKFLSICIDSILMQTYKNIEVILIDDGSTDNSGLICDKYAKMDKRVIALHQSNKGQASARNKGFRNSKGEWICFVDSDDAIHSEAIEILLDAAIRSKSLISEGAFVEVNDVPTEYEDKLQHHYDIYPVDEQHIKDEVFNCWIVCGKLIKRPIIECNLFTEGRIFEDNAIILKWLLMAEQVASTKEVIYYYRVNPEGTTKRSFCIKKIDFLWALEERMAIIMNAGYYDLLSQSVILYINSSFDICQSITQVLRDGQLKRNVKQRVITVTIGYLKTTPYRLRILKRLGKLIVAC